MWALTVARVLINGVKPLSRWSSTGAEVATVAIMLIVLVDVIMRNSLRIVLPGGVELVQVAMIIVMFGALAYAEVEKGHIRITILTDRFPPVARQAVMMGGELLTFIILCVITWRVAIEAQRLMIELAETGLLRVPMWPFAVAASVFFGFFALATLANFFQSLGETIKNNTRTSKWLVPSVTVAISLAIFLVLLWLSVLFPVKLGATTAGLLFLLVLFALLFLGVHTGAVMAMTALWGIIYLIKPGAGLSLLSTVTMTVGANYTWSVVAMFVLMGLLVSAGGLGRDVYRTTYAWLGRLPGGLASATIGACGALAAMVGDSTSGLVTMSAVALPEMKTHGYDEKLATGCICAGSTIGILIPPSLGFIIYGILVGESVGRLFIAGILPGILLVTMLIVMTTIRCRLNPALGPPGEPTTFNQKIVSLRYSWSVAVLFLLVIGGIYSGLFTPTEAGAIGATGALVISLAMRRLPFTSFAGAVRDTARMVAMIFFIFVFAVAFSNFVALSRLADSLANLVIGADVSPVAFIVIVIALYFVLGCLMNALPALVITLPLIFPVVKALGFDPVWFGVITVLMIEIGLLTPPIGMNAFIMSGITGVPMAKIFRGVVPFWVGMLIVVAILVAFPQISLLLPNLMMGR